MVKYSKIRKTASNVKKYVKKGAKAYLKLRRNPLTKQYLKGGSISTTAIAKQLMNMKKRLNASAEYKLLDVAHTAGNPDVSLREFYKISAASVQSTLSTTSTPGTTGYFLQEINMPSTAGDGIGNYDGKRILLSSIQWKGTLYSDTNSTNDASVKMMIIRYQDEDMDAFQMTELLNTDNNGEYSIASKKNFDFKNYKIVSTRTFKFSTGSTRRKDFNIFIKPNHTIRRYQSDNTILSYRYFALIVGSSDVAANNSAINYMGNTRVRFVA